MTEKELLELKDQIDASEKKITSLQAQKMVLMKQLKETFKCNTVKEAKAKLQKMKGELEELQRQYDEGCEKLEEDYMEES